MKDTDKELPFSTVFTLQGRRGKEWRNVVTAVNVSHHKVIEERDYYTQILEEDPQEMLWEEFRIIKVEYTFVAT